MTNTLQQVRELSDMEYLAKIDKENYDSLPLHEKFLQHFGEHQGMDGDYGEIDCGYEWNAGKDILDIHEIAEWIESENKVLASEWIAVTDERKPKPMIKNLIWHHDGIGIASTDNSGIWYDEFLNTPFGITHWQPLPNPPLPLPPSP